MKKIIEINVEMPYHSEVYAIGKEAYGAFMKLELSKK